MKVIVYAVTNAARPSSSRRYSLQQLVYPRINTFFGTSASLFARSSTNRKLVLSTFFQRFAQARECSRHRSAATPISYRQSLRSLHGQWLVARKIRKKLIFWIGCPVTLEMFYRRNPAVIKFQGPLPRKSR